MSHWVSYPGAALHWTYAAFHVLCFDWSTRSTSSLPTWPWLYNASARRGNLQIYVDHRAQLWRLDIQRSHVPRHHHATGCQWIPTCFCDLALVEANNSWSYCAGLSGANIHNHLVPLSLHSRHCHRMLHSATSVDSAMGSMARLWQGSKWQRLWGREHSIEWQLERFGATMWRTLTHKPKYNF